MVTMCTRICKTRFRAETNLLSVHVLANSIIQYNENLQANSQNANEVFIERSAKLYFFLFCKLEIWHLNNANGFFHIY